MKLRILTIIFLLTLPLTLACSLGSLLDKGEDTVSQDESPSQEERYCGDGVCDGPENDEKCPEDCQSSKEESSPPSGKGAIPPVYVTLAIHIEDVPVYTNCDAYPDFREKLLTFAEAFSGTGAAINLQIEHEFFVGTVECETEAMQADTNGQNVIDYLITRYGYEIDAHQEGGWEEEWNAAEDNYADIRYLGEQVTSSISENVGGMVWDDPDQFTRLSQGEPGQYYPNFTWRPQTLTLAVSHQHHQGNFSRDDFASGIWKPRGHGEAFWEHDPQGTLIYVGPGEHANWDDNRPWQSTPEFVQTIANQLQEETLDPQKMYTASIAIPQSILFYPERHPELLMLLEELNSLVESGQAVYVTYSQVVEIWQTEFNAQPNIFFLENATRPYEIAP